MIQAAYSTAANYCGYVCHLATKTAQFAVAVFTIDVPRTVSISQIKFAPLDKRDALIERCKEEDDAACKMLRERFIEIWDTPFHWS